MEKTYTIEWSERKTTSTNKEKIDCSLRDQQGNLTEKVSIWGDFPGFKDLMTGSNVTGSLVPAKDPKFGPTLYPPRPTTAPKGGAFKQMQIEKSMDKKAESIERFQDSKEFSIKVSSTFRAAHETALAEWQDNRRLTATGPTLEQLFEKWREFYWVNFDVTEDQYPPFKG